MKRFVTKQMVVFTGLLVSPVVTAIDYVAAQTHLDPRLGALKMFFDKHACPVSRFTKEFLVAADENALDWRLLPSISLVESGGGRDRTALNIFGWTSAKAEFASVPDAIRNVASRLAKSTLYRDKDTDGILKTYNPAPEYSYRVKAIMNTIGSANLAPTPATN